MLSKGILYIVSLSIGNTDDIGMRARALIGDCDAVLCEDARACSRLMGYAGLRPRRLISYHEHTSPGKRDALIDHIIRGASYVLVSDAGTPLISDPGYRLVRAAIAARVHIRVVPGPSAVLAGLVLSGLASDRFMFAGFPPPRSSARRQFFTELEPIKATLIIFESPRRLVRCLADMVPIFGPRPAAVMREMTKTFEDIRRDDLSKLAAFYQDDAPAKTVRGEITIVVAGRSDGPPDIEARRKQLSEDMKTMSASAAARRAAGDGFSRSTAYRLALEIREQNRGISGSESGSDIKSEAKDRAKTGKET